MFAANSHILELKEALKFISLRLKRGGCLVSITLVVNLLSLLRGVTLGLLPVEEVEALGFEESAKKIVSITEH